MRDEKGRFIKGHKPYKANLGKKVHPNASVAVSATNRRMKGKMGRNWKGGKILHQGKYWLIYSKGHPNADRFGYVREHRIVMEKHLGRFLGKGEVVHHINGDTRDNRVENLTIMSPNEHARHHSNIRWGNTAR